MTINAEKILRMAGVVFVLSTSAILAQAQTPEEGLALMKGSDCFTCHRVGQKLIGPSYNDVATKYKGADDAKITELANKVIKGGAGNWGTVPMKAHPEITLENAKKMVQWVLSQSGAAEAAPGATTTTPGATPSTTPATTTPTRNAVVLLRRSRRLHLTKHLPNAQSGLGGKLDPKCGFQCS